ncbi:uncharacterized protein LOC111879366 [Lactuca sativa]|nr:uncharacterized protein LOC111879366 [Lactuca sativa]XP_023731575.1 uncharacterized protein LOC111879366 [Lactuca sativa]XP_023731576.1 uncharacterized protein LOC111879366 [Lactuca sativa]XP_023731577.1 uncharacterized protein LOC111879366 [Lactuca sativa]
MEQLLHFTHDHTLSLVHLQPASHDSENSDEEEEKEEGEEDDFVAEEKHVGKCKMCKEGIYSFHMSYYECKDCDDDYSLHKFCAEMPKTLQNHPSHDFHPYHNLTLSKGFFWIYSSDEWACSVCNLMRKNIFNYMCSICEINMDIICATMSQQKMDHPSHPHQLQRMSKELVSHCSACGEKHQGTFYQCTTCLWYSIHLDCALLPAKLLIQQHTDATFTHSHPLTLAYSFPEVDQKAKYNPRCRVCKKYFDCYLWLYKCDKCQYYAHINCATSKTEPFMSIFLHPGGGKTYKNFKDDDYPNLLHCPFPDESYNLLRHYFIKNKKEFITMIKEEEHGGEMLNHFSHQHPLILLDTHARQTSVLGNKSIVLHDPMKKIQVLCDACLKPITEMPYYKCSEISSCGFVLHEWCARLPSKIQDHPGHPEHVLVLVSKNPQRLMGLFFCYNCCLYGNSFAYGCAECEYYVDINCAFLPKEITHEAHPGHLLSRINASSADLSKKLCNSCRCYLEDCNIAFHCPSCDFYLDTECALLLPGMMRHKFDKHPFSLRYNPVENHSSDYFCEICEENFNPELWFYHCSSTCAQSMHPACAPLILECEQHVYAKYGRGVFEFVNVKFGGTVEIKGLHPHRLSFLQGIQSHGLCKVCTEELQYDMIFKCLECDEYALHCFCVYYSDNYVFN